jgi:asparagine synthase (glutamine-hydrolysing)
MNFLSLLNKDIKSFNSLNFNRKFIYINRECNLKHWNSYLDDKNNIHIMILGRPVLEVNEWKNFKKSEENYISKILIKKFIELNINDFCNQLNGAFTILIIDYNKNNLIIITDKLGIYPIYIHGKDALKSLQFSSNLNMLVDNIVGKIDLDKTSLAEFLKKGFIYHPNTFYKEIKTLDNGSYCVLDFQKDTIIINKYFKIKHKPKYDFNYLVNKLSKALLKSIERRTLRNFGNKVVFLSGGSDSRTILANSSDPTTHAITLYNEENHEIKITKKITKTLKAKHFLIKRDKNYYFKSFNDSIKINGGRSLPTDDHFLNLKNDERIKHYDSILTGCYADWMFKGIALDRKQLSFFSLVKLPIYKLKSFHYNFFSKRTSLKKNYEKMIKKREDQIFLNKDSHFDNEINRIFPLFQEETSATRLTLQQLFSWDSIFSDNDVIEAFEQIPVKYKINSQVYDKAISLILKKVKNIPHANKRHKIGINKYSGAIIYCSNILFNKILKILRVKKTNVISGEGSWVNHKEYAKSENIKSLWNKLKNFELFNEIIDFKEMNFKEIIKKDYKLIYKCIVLDKVLKKSNHNLNENSITD